MADSGHERVLRFNKLKAVGILPGIAARLMGDASDTSQALECAKAGNLDEFISDYTDRCKRDLEAHTIGGGMASVRASAGALNRGPNRARVSRPSPRFRAQITPDEVKKHNTRGDCWLVLGQAGNKKVYDVTAYMVGFILHGEEGETWY
jgi:cytochrome b involved in lipid metabolism